MKKASVMCACLVAFLFYIALACAESDIKPHLQGFPYESFEYTQELTYGSFKIGIPSSFTFNQKRGPYDSYCYLDTDARIDISYDDTQTQYTNPGELIEKYLFIAENSLQSWEFARADECIALVLIWDMFGHVTLNVCNRQEMLNVVITIESDPTRIDRSDRATYCTVCKSIAHEILEHIVAPENPLK